MTRHKQWGCVTETRMGAENFGKFMIIRQRFPPPKFPSIQ